ncbi:hypothetical protein EXIGLDRAFT_773921 [Exidia glandulosa HHB12029]|uniref:Mediator of RNA polymerase II transcription subunit 25 n=1 Tax=Exidia glandulosa HHB12029 TaxID=1314781 RepID=A0A165EL62_EXIGL|nr:hypothetical protein EXIGLDRAFT_773921 [Exidia glandulosa HHB12029]
MSAGSSAQSAPALGPDVNLVVVFDASLALGLEFWVKYATKYLTAVVQKIQVNDGKPQRTPNIAWVSYGAADTRPSPILTRRFFAPLNQTFSGNAASFLGLGQVGVRAKGGLALLEGLVAALELCDACIDPPLIEQTNSLHKAPPPRPPKPLLHVLLFAALPPDDAMTPSWNTNAAFDNTTWESLGDEMRKREIGLNMILTSPSPKLADLHKAVVANPTPAWFAPIAPGHTYHFEHFTPSKAPAVHHPVIQPKVLQENKRPLEDPGMSAPDAKRLKPSVNAAPIVPPAPAPAVPKVETTPASASSTPSIPSVPDTTQQHKDLFLLQQYVMQNNTLRAHAATLSNAEAQGKPEEEIAQLKADVLLKATALKRYATQLVQRGLLTPDLKPKIPVNMPPGGLPAFNSGASAGTGTALGASPAPSIAKTDFSPTTTAVVPTPGASTSTPAAMVSSPFRNVAPAPPPPPPSQPVHAPAHVPPPAPAPVSPAMAPKPPAIPAPGPAIAANALPMQQREQLIRMINTPNGMEQLKKLIAMKPEMKGIVLSIMQQNHQLKQPQSGMVPPLGGGQPTMPQPQPGPSNPPLIGLGFAPQVQLQQQQQPPPPLPQPQPSMAQGQASSQQTPVWQGSITWTVQSTTQRVVPVIAITPRGDLRFDLWPSQLQLKPYKKTFSSDELTKWTHRHQPPICKLELPPGSNGSPSDSQFKELIALLATKQAIALVDVPVAGMAQGIHLVIFAHNSSLAVAAFIDKPVPELIDGPMGPNPAVQQQLMAFMSALSPEQRTQFSRMSEQMRMQTLQQYMTRAKVAAAQQQMVNQQQQQQQHPQASMLAAAGIPMLGSSFAQQQQQQQQQGFGQPAQQPGGFGGPSHMQPGISLPQGMTLPPGFQNQPWQQRPPGQ